ncbi:hypothetical protein EW026_g787 [Hermanssonia centrifuga]|uniref:EF-hand domain-containing protein n=1 Tax=Hermanssonia centrifuga TaxID=98765 RepID=A0A4S4KVD2_9APHY|nr:hypothetical protein EW026_g787 [Hermanssonia centrifuga]
MPVPCPTTAFESDADDLICNIAYVAELVQAGPPVGSHLERTLDKQGDKVDDLADHMDAMNDAHETVQAFKSGVDTFMEDAQCFVKILDEVAKLHPFVAAAPILAFKAVYSMERTRRENDKRIISLYVAMKDMIVVLIQLQNVKDPTHVGPDGVTIEARMQSLASLAAEDIKDCANVCDTYSKKKLLVKVLKGPIWESRLTEFIGRFARRQSDFKFALAIHTATVADSMREAVDGIDDKVAALTDMLHMVFKEFKPQDEASLAAKVDEKGGADYVQGNDMILRELLAYEDSIMLANQNATSKIEASRAEQFSNTEIYAKLRPDMNEQITRQSSLKDLKNDLGEDWKTAVDRNMQVFQRKFSFRKKQLQELSLVIHEENDRIIQELSAGPHDTIHNKELKEVWQEMGWRRNVESNLFVTTLRDHFKDKLEMYGPRQKGAGHLLQDEWAIKYLGIRYLRLLKEALDEDGSGYITTSEVNRFTERLPENLGWSLQHWIAYWTIGWQISAASYREQIRRLFAQMFAMRSKILPENRRLVDNYLQKVWSSGVKLVEALQPVNNVPSHIKAKFLPYVQYEEERIAQNLDGIKYNVDALDTVYMVIGPGRLENHIFPLMYLLLRRDIELFRLAKHQIFWQDDLFITAISNMQWVYDSVTSRYRELSALFKHKGLDVGSQMKIFACELFEFYHDASPLWKSIHAQTKLDQEAIEGFLDPDRESSRFDFEMQDSTPDFQSPYEVSRHFHTNAQVNGEAVASIV